VFAHQPLFEAIASQSLPSISDFETQALSNIARAFAHLAYNHQPLLNSIAEASLKNISYFDSQGLANTAWSLDLFGLLHKPLRAAISSAAIKKIKDMEPQSYALLADLELSCQGEIQKYLWQVVSRFISATSSVSHKSGDGFLLAAEFANLTADMRVDNLGRTGTRWMLDAFGISDISTNFHARALQHIAPSLSGSGPAPFQVFSFVEYDVVVAGQSFIGSSLSQNGLRNSTMSRPRWLRSTRLPINTFVDRDLCAEFQLLEIICDKFFAAMTSEGTSVFSNVSGHLRLFVTGSCCVSCVGAILQFQRLWSGVSVSIGMASRSLSLLQPSALEVAA
jgi:hypothetical protein